jgi:hypothetical protein
MLRLALPLVVLGGLFAFPGWGDDERQSSVQPSARVAAENFKVAVGANIQVSTAKAELPHRECVIAADPTNAARIFAAAIYLPAGAKRPAGAENVVGYFSHDGGKTWQLSFAHEDGVCSEPAAAFGPDGSLYFVRQHVTLEDFARPRHKPGEDNASLHFYRSTDGGKAFEPVATIARQAFLDRPWLAVDCTDGKDRGRLYCCASIGKPVVFTSDDRGKTFAPPLIWATKPLTFHTGSPAILSDGTLVLMYGVYQFSASDPRVRPRVFVLLSRDGGRSLQEAATVTRDWHCVQPPSPFPQLAADQTGGKYRNRVYAVWADRAAEDGESRILFSLSKDKGQSWTEPQLLSEQPAAAEQDYASYLPAVAVSKDGVVAVSWYDRRGLPRGKRGEFPPGWNVRLRVSPDGGETWQPSVQVNEKTGKAPYNQVRDTAGLAADADGGFHPVWIDDRTGKRQVWTATVKVEAK